MFDFPGADGIQSYKDDQQVRLLASFNLDKAPLAQATLIKGISVNEFDRQFPADKFERYSHNSLSQAKDELTKGGTSEEDFTASTSNMKPVVVASGNKKVLMYVRAK